MERIYSVPCFPRWMSKYLHKWTWSSDLSFWNLPIIRMDGGVNGNPLVPHLSPTSSLKPKKVETPNCASRKNRISTRFQSSNGLKRIIFGLYHFFFWVKTQNWKKKSTACFIFMTTNAFTRFFRHFSNKFSK